MNTRIRWQRIVALVAAPVTLLTSVALVALPAQADTAPAAGTAATVSSDSLAAPQINGVVWSQAVANNTVFVGGNFSQAQPSGAAAGVNAVSRADMLAYNLTTGVLSTTFAPSFNGQVRGVAVSPDGSTVYAVGDFTTVNGATHNRIVALDASSGAVRPGFTATANGTVYSVATSGSTVYFAGSFTSVNSTGRSRAAAVTATTGAITGFAPVMGNAIVHALVVSPDGSKVVLGGNFTGLNGDTSVLGLGAVDSATGQQNQTWNAGKVIYNHGSNSSIWSLSSDGTNVYGSGYVYGGQTDGNLEGAFNARWSDGTINWIEDCHGDSYGVAALGDAVYTVSHDHYCGNVPNGFAQTDPNPSAALKQYSLAFSKATAGTLSRDPYGPPYVDFNGTPAPKLLTWYPDLTPGSFTGQSQAAWTITATNGYLLLGGEFGNVNQKRQVGLARFAVTATAPNKDGPRLSGAKWTPSAVSLAAGSVRVSWPSNWDRDNANLTYALKRGTKTIYTTTAESEGFWLRPTLGYIDSGLTPGSSATYTVTATDPFGNTATSTAVTTTVSSGGDTSAYSNAVLADGASDYWRFGEASGPTAYDWAGYSDLTAGAGVVFGAAGAIQGDSNTSATFSGDATGLAATQSAIPGPNTFTAETWFKTTSTTGGKIVGFGDKNTGTSSSYDRHVYMDANGAVYFGVYNGNTSTLQSTAGYNDGKWHYVAASLSSAGMQLFLDGKKIGSRTDVTVGQAYNGYWRVGGDTSWNGASFFTGSIDDTAIYPTALSATTVKAHYADSGYGTVTPTPTDAYGKQIFSQGPDTYWRLGDAGGSSTVADASGNGDTGNVLGGVTLGSTGGVVGTSDTAATFDGANGLVVASQPQVDPEVYTLQLWFKTNTTRGGKLIGFGDQQSGVSNNYDRHIWMLDSGQLEFGVWTGQTNTVTSASAYNDGAWHQVVATQGADGLTMFVDGHAVGNNPNTRAQSYQGYWRLGGDHAWGGNSSEFFAGTMDEVAIYSSELSSAQIANDYQLGAAVASNAPPVAAFTATPTNLQVALDATGSSDSDGSVASYAWDFGDGTPVETDATATTTHTYAAGGAYTVSLTVTDDKGATNTITKVVTATRSNAAPTAAFTSNVTGLGVSLDASASTDSDGAVASYGWNFGDGTAVETDTVATTTHTYASGGSYTVSLTVTDNDGATTTVTHGVTVAAPNRPPVVSFTSSIAGLKASFDGTGSSDPDGTISSYAWDFGDGTTGTGATTDRTYAAGGTYTVQLTVTDNGGASAATTSSVTVAAPSSSTLASDAFNRTTSAGLGTADVGGPWTLSGTASDFSVAPGAAQFATAAGQTRSAYVGNVSSTSTDVVSTISLPGLPVGGTSFAGVIGRRVGTTDYGARVLVSASGAVTVEVDRGTALLKTGTVTGLTYTPGLPLRVRLQVTGTNPTTVQARVWKASDAEPTTWKVSTTDSTAALQAAGSVGLRSYLGGGVTSGKTAFAFSAFSAQSAGGSNPPTNAAPAAAFTATPTGLTVAADGTASSDSDGTVSSYAWDFGDGGTGTGSTVSHTYAAAGTFTVKLVVTDNGGATGTLSKQVTVSSPPPANAAPVAAFTVTPTDLTVAADGTASSDSDGTVSSYAWDFGDGGTGTGSTVSHTYAAAGTFTVKLVVTDNGGATGTLSKQVTVTEPTGPAVHTAADAFARSVASGLGTADTGGAWTVANKAAYYSVDGSSAVFANPAGQTLSGYLNTVSSSSTDVSASAILPALPVGGSMYAGVVGRRVGTDDYSSRLLVAANGTVKVELLHGSTALKSVTVSGLTVQTGSTIHLRMQVTGTSPTTLRARAWLDGTTEPTTWQTTTTDTTAALQTAGYVGVRTYLGSSVTNGPAAIKVDDFLVDPVN